MYPACARACLSAPLLSLNLRAARAFHLSAHIPRAGNRPSTSIFLIRVMQLLQSSWVLSRAVDLSALVFSLPHSHRPLASGVGGQISETLKIRRRSLFQLCRTLTLLSLLLGKKLAKKAREMPHEPRGPACLRGLERRNVPR